MPNHLETQTKQGGSVMAGLLLCVFGVSGCLPPEESTLPFIPDKKNLPPRVLSGGWLPPNRQATVLFGTFNTTTCKRTQFSVQVDDDSKQLEDRWYIDPNDEHKQEIDRPVIAGNGAPDNGGIRELRAPTALLTALSSYVGDGKRHQVEVIVTDGHFNEDRNGALTLDPTENGVDELKVSHAQTPYRDNFIWLVEVQQCPSGP